MATVGNHSVSPFPSPVRGPAVDANIVRGNDNSLQQALVAHDADATIHVQSSTLASRPAAGVEGRVWVTEDAGTYEVWYDDGSSWQQITGGSGSPIALDDLTDVTIVSPSSGQVLQYNGANWVNATVTYDLDDLTDVAVAGPTTGQILEYNGALWVNVTPTAATYALDDLTDVVINTPANGQVLKYNGAFWVNSNAVNNLTDLGDVTISSVATGQLLRYNGSTWTNVTNVDLPGTLDVTGNATFDSTLTLNTVTYTFPASDGTSSQALTTDGSGNLSWQTVGGSSDETAWNFSNYI